MTPDVASNFAIYLFNLHLNSSVPEILITYHNNSTARGYAATSVLNAEGYPEVAFFVSSHNSIPLDFPLIRSIAIFDHDAVIQVFEDATVSPEELLPDHQQPDQYYIYRGSQLLVASRTAEAMTNFRQAVAINPQSYRGWFNIATLADQLPEKLQAYESFLQHAPANFNPAMVNMAIETLQYHGRPVPQRPLHDIEDQHGNKEVFFTIEKGDTRSLIALENDTDKDWDELQQTVYAFMDMTDWLNAYLYLQQHPELLGTIVNVWIEMLYNVTEDPTERNFYQANFLLLRRCSEKGPLQVFAEEMNMSAGELQLLERGVNFIQPKTQELFDATTDDQKAAVIQKYPELTNDPATIPFLAYLKGAQTSEDALAYIDYHIRLLKEFNPSAYNKQETVTDAFEEGMKLFNHGQQAGSINMIMAAIQLWEELAEKSVVLPDKETYLMITANIGVAYLAGYSIGENIENLQQAITIFKNVMATASPGAWSYQLCVVNMSHAWYLHFEKSGDTNSLNHSVELLQNNKQHFAKGTAEYGSVLNNLGAFILKRGEYFNYANDYDHAIEYLNESMSYKAAKTHSWGASQGNLGLAYLNRYEIFERISDLELAEKAFRQLYTVKDRTRKETIDYHIGMARVLRSRSIIGKDPHSITLAIEEYKQALGLTETSGSLYYLIYNNISNSYRTQYEIFNEKTAINNAIEAGRIAIGINNPRHYQFHMYQENLAKSLTMAFKATQDESYLDEAITIYQTVLDNPAYANRNLTTCLANLGAAYHFKSMADGNHNNINAAIHYYQSSLAATPVERSPAEALLVCRNLAELWVTLKAWDKAWPVLSQALKCLDLLYENQFTQSDQQTFLTQCPHVYSIAAYTLVMLYRQEEAVVTIEKWRAKSLNQALDLRFQNVQPLLEQGYTSYAEEYRIAAIAVQELTQYERSGKTDLTSADTAKIQLARKRLDDSLASIRQLPGFAAFLKDLTIANIYDIATIHPLLYLTVSPAGSMALLVSRQKATAITLPNLHIAELEAIVKDYMDKQTAWRNQQNNPLIIQSWFDNIDHTVRWIWSALWEDLIPHLSNERELAIIPGGLLGYLPLHAGRAPHGETYIQDILKISYLPNAKVCRRVVDNSIDNLLLIENPTTETALPLPFANLEASMTRSYFQRTTYLQGEKASLETVVQTLANSNVIHFGCHGVGNMHHPLDSHILLAGDIPLTLAALTKLNLWKVRLVVLSACETGVIGIKLPDEFISLATGFIEIGASAVIASLWSVYDCSTALLIIKFYELWQEQHYPPPSALHHAQQWLRTASNERLSIFFDDLKNKGNNSIPLPDELIDEQLTKFTLSSYPDQQPFAHPFYWAGFIILGA